MTKMKASSGVEIHGRLALPLRRVGAGAAMSGMSVMARLLSLQRSSSSRNLDQAVAQGHGDALEVRRGLDVERARPCEIDVDHGVDPSRPRRQHNHAVAE